MDGVRVGWMKGWRITVEEVDEWMDGRKLEMKGAEREGAGVGDMQRLTDRDAGLHEATPVCHWSLLCDWLSMRNEACCTRAGFRQRDEGGHDRRGEEMFKEFDLSPLII